ncbi:MAG: hypothetical protein HC859_04660 [Bacteroidia bacterium]|nr:hypothetical protein [Bacteroidia bacterium]
MVEYFDGFGGGGTWNSIAYTQMEFAPLMQLASLTGIWGITFLIGWFATLLFEAVTAPAFTWPRRSFLAFVAVVASAWVFGAFRTHPYFQRDGYTVRTAGITYNNAALLKAMYHDAFGAVVDIDEDRLTQNSPELQTLQKGFVRFIENPDSLKFKITYRAMSRQQDSLLALAAQEAEAGARLIVFSEAAFIMPKHMEETFTQRAAAVASRYHIWLVAGVAAIRTGKIETGKPFIENKLMVWGSEGKLIHTFYKNKPVPLVEPSIAGDGAVPVIETPFGRMAISICYDADFPALMRKAGRQRADMLVLPSGDWREIAPYHARMASVRAIENGFSLVRPVSGAHSIVTNSSGAVTGDNNFYAAGGKVFVANVPINTRKTLYANIGDVLPCVCIPVLVALVAYSFVRRRRS